ncbi:MAG TPA: response regulator transcription factor [Edaphocola sp.]|nr:response regulator transcription factor [Edaphocola sp.]
MEITNQKILIVDDEEDIVDIIRYNLEHSGFEIETAMDGLDAIRKAKTFLPDLILLDIMMPKMSGTEVLPILKKDPQLKDTFVIFLTAMNSEHTEVEGLNMGADDYIVKPIKPKVLLSRIQSVLRRGKTHSGKIIEVGDIKIDKDKHEIFFKGHSLNLTGKEFKLLELLTSKPGKAFSRDEILNHIWDDDTIVGDRTIDVHIRRLRQKTDLDLIVTIKGFGYKIDT